MQIYANLLKINEKCYFSVISWPILILFGLSDRAWWGLQNFYTEFGNSLITVRAEIFAVVLFSRISRVKPSRKFPLQFMSIYSNDNISKVAKLTPRELPDLAKTAKITVRENNGVYSMQIYANLFKINEKCYFSISWAILILFGLSDRAWCGLQNFYTEYWNSLIMQIYANLFKLNEKCHLSSIQKSQQICTSGGGRILRIA